MRDLLFIHGNSLGASTFKYQLEDVTLKEHFRMWAPDLPGHSRGIRRDKYSHTLLLDFLQQFIADKNIEQLDIVGHSLGGHLAIDLLQRDINFKFNSLAIIGTPPLMRPIDAKAFKDHPIMPLVFRDQLTSDMMLKMSRAFGHKDFQTLIDASDPKIRVDLFESLQAGMYPDEVQILNKFDGKLACIIGEHDPLINADYIRALNLNLWKNDLIVIKGAGHTPQYDAPDIFNTFLHDFLIPNADYVN